MMDQFRIPMQHLKLYKMEASFKSFVERFHAKIFLNQQLWILMLSGGYTLKCWSLNIMDFELASTPKNVIIT